MPLVDPVKRKAYMHEYNKTCRATASLEQRKHRKEQDREYYLANREQIRKKQSRRYADNIEKERERCRDKVRQNPWGHRARGLNRRAGFKFVTDTDLQRIYEAADGRCYYCGCHVSSHTPMTAPNYSIRKNEGGVSFDHVEPGVHRLSNIVVACGECNRQKQDNTVESLERLLRQIKRHRKANLEEV